MNRPPVRAELVEAVIGEVGAFSDSPPHPDAFVPVVVSMTEPSSVADDRVVAANGTSPRQEVQRYHPGSALSSSSGSAIKRITAGVKAAADRRCQVSI
jgi:hypothetical protein